MMAALHGASRSTRKELLTVAGGHNDTWKKGAAMEGISRFVAEVTRD